MPLRYVLPLVAPLSLNASALEVTVSVDGLKSDRGALVVSVYDSAEHWLSDNTVLRQRLELSPGAQDELQRIPLTLEQGSYAISVYHDANGNGELDANFIGIPKEPVGLSNGHRPKFGPPKFDKARLRIDADQYVAITLD